MDRKVLFDTDPGNDDAVMLLVALAHDDVEVVGCTTGAGNTSLENATANTLGLLELVGRTEVPVARGCGTPFANERADAEGIHGPNGIATELPEPTVSPVERHGVDFIIDQAYEHGDDLTIAAVAPQTNLAVALAKEPDLPEIVDEIYVMGGNVSKTGNVTPMATFNFYYDAVSANKVIQECAPKIVGLEVAEKARIPGATVGELEDQGGIPEKIAQMMNYTAEESAEKYGYDAVFLHDVCVIADIIGDVLTYHDSYTEVLTSDGLERGAVYWDEYGATDNPPNSKVAVDVDLDGYQRLVVETLQQYV